MKAVRILAALGVFAAFAGGVLADEDRDSNRRGPSPKVVDPGGQKLSAPDVTPQPPEHEPLAANGSQPVPTVTTWGAVFLLAALAVGLVVTFGRRREACERSSERV